MSIRQISVSDFAAHCVEEIDSLQHGDTTLELMSGGRVVAVLSPSSSTGGNGGALTDWMGLGASLMRFGPDYDSAAPAFDPEEWEAFQDRPE